MSATPAVPLCEQPFEHICKHGTLFRAERSDMAAGVEAILQAEKTDRELAEDVFEFCQWVNETIGYIEGIPDISVHRY